MTGYLELTLWFLKNPAPTSSETSHRSGFGTGLMVLLVAQILSAIMGLYTEEVYKVYGPQWRENLFYCHALSLPLFLPFSGSLASQLRRLSRSSPLHWDSAASSWTRDAIEGWMPCAKIQVPSKLVYLGANVLTQFACIRGVNLLAAASSALTVTIVLNIRKLVSLLLSIWLFENQLAVGTILGAIIVFGAGALYSLDSRTRSPGNSGRSAGAQKGRPA